MFFCLYEIFFLNLNINFKVIGNRLAQVHFYKKDDVHQSSGETMETLVHKTSVSERNINANPASSHVHYSSMSNTNAPSQMPQVLLSQPAPLPKAAIPIRDSAQFVSSKQKIQETK